MDDARARWQQIEAALDDLLNLPETERDAALDRIGGEDPDLCDELRSLLAQVDGDDALLDHSPLAEAVTPPPSEGSLGAGACIGIYRIVDLIGRGGMGEVYRAERADGQYEQRVALKLIRRELIDQASRFQTERQLLARLDHPGIARLLDGGIAADGRPYMVMELVSGHTIVDWCRQRQSPLEERLRLFLAVCDAVAYAHRNLVVHRDIKPGNVLVTADGTVKLLDFGIARLLGAGDETQTRSAPLTPGYAAPEQLTQDAVTTATDVYALGLLLFELLTGERPWQLGTMPLVAAIRKVLTEDTPAPSRFAQTLPHPAVASRLLRGDLDAIVAKAIRKEPAGRYPDARALSEDIQRFIAHEPVRARDGARLYVMRRYLRRHWLPLAAAAAVFSALVAGIIGVRIEAVRAEREAARATAVKDFLIDIFRVSDPRIARDRHGDQITARDLLDTGSARIDQNFATQPDLQIELLGIVTEIYGYLDNDEEHFAALEAHRVDLARRYYGPSHPIVIQAMLADAWSSIYPQDYSEAGKVLAEIDRLLNESGQNHSLLRAEWYFAKAKSLQATPGALAEREQALARSVSLYEELAPKSDNHAAALSNAAILMTRREQYAAACSAHRAAIAIEQAAPDRDDSNLMMMYKNLAYCEQAQGQFVQAEADYGESAKLARSTGSEHSGSFWDIQSSHARMLALRGERTRAQALFKEALDNIPGKWLTTTDDTLTRERQAESLSDEGRPDLAIPPLEQALEVARKRPKLDTDLCRIELALGDAYDRIGETGKAREQLDAAMSDPIVRNEPSSTFVLQLRERRARFHADHAEAGSPEAEAARLELSTLIADSGERPLASTALAHADLAALALRHNDIATAIAEYRAAEQSLQKAGGLHDIRDQPYVWLIGSRVQLAAGSSTQAHALAASAVDAYQRYDDPQSLSLQSARVVLQKLEPSAASGTPDAADQALSRP